MPFHSPFRQRYNIGDIVYGLSDERRVYSRTYSHFRDSGIPTNMSTIDQYAVTNVERKYQVMFSRTLPANQMDFLIALRHHEKYKSIIDAVGFCLREKACHHHQAIGRKCKAGLHWAANSSSPIHIHFILDNINLSQVVGKNHERDRNERSFTGVELRWLYRNRNDVNVQKCVQFWRQGIPVPPPWVTDPKLWNSYTPRSALPAGRG